ncbi:MAG: hypothetical protein H6702_13120 [Myxococcales bacterium]|nr:hypothetical protein [Myxococcales bacterium]
MSLRNTLALTALFAPSAALAAPLAGDATTEVVATAPETACGYGVRFDGRCRADGWFEARAAEDRADRTFDGVAVYTDLSGRETAILLEVDDDGALWATQVTSARTVPTGPTRMGYPVLSNAVVRVGAPTGDGIAVATEVYDVVRVTGGTLALPMWRMTAVDALTVGSWFYTTPSGEMGTGTCAQKGELVEADRLALCKEQAAMDAYCLMVPGNMTRRVGPCVSDPDHAWMSFVNQKLASALMEDGANRGYGIDLGVDELGNLGFSLDSFATTRTDVAQYQIDKIVEDCRDEAVLAKAKFLAEDCIDEVDAEDPLDPYRVVQVFQDEAGGAANPLNDHVEAENDVDEAFDPDEFLPNVSYKTYVLADGSVVYEYADGTLIHNTNGGAIVCNSTDPGYIGFTIVGYDERAHRFVLKVLTLTP